MFKCSRSEHLHFRGAEVLKTRQAETSQFTPTHRSVAGSAHLIVNLWAEHAVSVGGNKLPDINKVILDFCLDLK